MLPITLFCRLIDTLRESGKKDEASLTARFLDGEYPGVPYTVEKDAAEAGGSAVWKYVALVVVVLVGGGVCVVSANATAQDL